MQKSFFDLAAISAAANIAMRRLDPGQGVCVQANALPVMVTCRPSFHTHRQAAPFAIPR
jgi:hypothetical protein